MTTSITLKTPSPSPNLVPSTIGRRRLASKRKPRRWLQPLVWLLCAGVAIDGASGCAFSRGDLGAPINDSDVASIKKGRTTEAQVIALLGAPDTIHEVNHQEVFHYYRYALKHATVLVFSRVNIASDDLYVFFDREGVVDQVVFGNQTNKLKFQFWPFGE
jgi:outer membrane protein assembly factor BamE (lipoprotein component of BamABCDE complex)